MLTFTDIQRIVAERDWTALLGQQETDAFDGKKVQYDLSSDSQKQELVKDVTSFANSVGGFILLGIETGKAQTHLGDAVISLRPFPSDRLDADRYLKILEEWIDPPLEGVSVSWVPEADGAAQGFGVISIPEQADHRKPFVLCKVISEDGRRRTMLVGYVQRKQEVSLPSTAQEVAQWLRDGRSYQLQTQARLNEMDAKLDVIRAAMAPALDRPDSEIEEKTVNDRIKSTVGVNGMINRPHYVIAAYPSPRVELRTIFQSGPGTITAALEKPPVLRYAGWSLETLDQARIVEGQFRELTNGDRKTLRLYRDGMLAYAVAADDAFLGVGESPDQFRTNPRIISLALIEVTYLFCLFYAEVLKDMPMVPDTISLRFLFGRMHEGGTDHPVRLNPFGVKTFAYYRGEGEAPAPSDGVTREIQVEAQGFKPEAAAYKLIREVYLWFGIEPTLIPYTDELNSVAVISPDRILAVN